MVMMMMMMMMMKMARVEIELEITKLAFSILTCLIENSEKLSSYSVM